MKRDPHANTDSAEIAKFEQAASRWWDPKGEFRSLHHINPFRVNYIHSRAPLAGKTVLDVGCGGGILSEAMATLGARVLGIDMGEAPLRAARAHAGESGRIVEYRQATAEAMAETRPAGFDVVTCLELLEHVPDPQSVVMACGRLVKPGGDVFFATLNRTPKAYLFAVLGAEHILRLLPRGTHHWSKFVQPEELTDWALKAGLIRLDLAGMRYNPFTRRSALSRDVRVNYLMHCRSPRAESGPSVP